MSMIIYNVTINVDDEIHHEWLDWMRDVHIPEVMNTGLFEEHRFCKVLVDDPSGTTYSVQYQCRTMADYVVYRDEHASALQQKVLDRYSDKLVAFRTLLEQV